MTVVYCAVGEQRFIQEVLISARSVRSTNPDCRIVCFTDRSDLKSEVFDEVRQLTVGGDPKVDKLVAIRDAPADRFVFLDTDTLVLGSLSPLFDLLDKFDFAAAIENRRNYHRDPDMCRAFPELNTGVLAVRRGAWLRDFCDRWIEQTRTERFDQPSFRRLLWASDLRYYALSPEWNCMYQAGERIVGPVVVLHGRPNIEPVATRINRARRHHYSNDLAPRYFKGEGGGLHRLRRDARVALNYFKLWLHRKGLFTRWKPR